MNENIEYRILGPIEVLKDGRPLRLGGPRQREVLAVLLLHPGPLSVERIVATVWGDEPPETAATAVHGHVSSLRKLLGRDAIVTLSRGYLLDANPELIDSKRFETIVAAAARENEPETRAALLREALSLWRGEPLSDVAHEWFGQTDVTRLRELRLVVLEDRVEAELALGRHGELVPELEALVAEHPFRERMWGQLMLALYRSGRQSDALHAYQRVRTLLARELGIGPGPVLERLETQILEQHPDLELGLEGPRRGVPPGLPRTERKFATALFVDVVGSTRLTERKDPEVVRSLLRQTLDRVADIVEAHGGLVENVMGDAVLAMFGVPVVHEDDPLRAVRAALEIQDVVTDINRASAESGALSLHIGLEAGEILVELARTDRGRMIIGNAVNTAARLQSAAEPGQIVVGPVAYSLTRGLIDYQALTPLMLKGKADLVQAWFALRSVSPGGERAPLGFTSRLIGRDDELSLLTSTFQRVASGGRPSLVTILGPAGVGKSRLAAEFVRLLDETPQSILSLKGRCLAYGNVSYSALAQAMKAHCKILEDDPPEIVTEKVDRVIEELFGDGQLAPHLESLVGGTQSHQLTRESLFEAWRRVLERLAARSALVLQLEDIHWADAGLLDFIDHLADWGQGPIVVLTMARLELLETRAGWGGGKRNYVAIYLDPLSEDETRLMLEALLSMSLPEALTRAVFNRSEGNPLFSEELVRVLVDRGAIRAGPDRWEVEGALESDALVPHSIQGVIAARLDAFPDGEKDFIQSAAVVGRTFWLGAARRLSGQTEEEARANLNSLQRKEVLTVREPPTFSDEIELSFRHVLIRDVAYDSVPKALRADKHVDAAKWIEQQAVGRQDDLAELLATHYVQAVNYLDELGQAAGHRRQIAQLAFRWARAAGERARRLWQQREAIKWFGIAIDLAPQVGMLQEEVATLWESYGRAGEEIEPYSDVADRYKRALSLYHELGRKRDAGRVEARLAFIAHQSGNHDAVLPAAQRALSLLEPYGDSGDLARAVHVLGWQELRTMQYEPAEADLLRAIRMAERVGHEVTRGQAMVSLAFVYQQTGRPDESLALFERALELARRVGDISLLLRTLTHICGALEELGRYAEAEGFARDGVELARRAGNVRNIAWTEQMLSDLLIDRGRFHEAEEAVERALEAARAVGEELVIGYGLERVAYLHAMHGDAEAAEQALEEARSIVAANPEPWLQGWEPLIAGHIARARNRPDEATDMLVDGARRLLDRLLVWGGKSLLIECIRSLAKVGRAAEAAPFRARLEQLAVWSPPARAVLSWADGLMASTPEEAKRLLNHAAEQLEKLEQLVDLGRCLIDLGATEMRLREDPSVALARAHSILESSGAVLFVREVEQLTASIPSPD